MLYGLDTNILCYLLDPAFPEHRRVSGLLRSLSPELNVAINPTVLHESYHTLVYYQKWTRDDAKSRLRLILNNRHIKFYNQTKSVSVIALNLAGRYQLGGRDSLILANFLGNHVTEVYTHDSDLLKTASVSWMKAKMRLTDPVVAN